MSQYRVSEIPINTLTSEQLRAEAGDLRYQLACVTADISSKKSWGDADNKQELLEYKIWMARARDFLKKLNRRYALVRPVEKKLNRAEFTSKRHVTRAEFDNHVKGTPP